MMFNDITDIVVETILSSSRSPFHKPNVIDHLHITNIYTLSIIYTFLKMWANDGGSHKLLVLHP